MQKDFYVVGKAGNDIVSEKTSITVFMGHYGTKIEGIPAKKEVTVNGEDEIGKISVWPCFDDKVLTVRWRSEDKYLSNYFKKAVGYLFTEQVDSTLWKES